MKIFIASDHAGYNLKSTLIVYLGVLGHEVSDCGPYEYNEADDYPDYMSSAAAEVSKNPNECRGILIGGSGQGEAMVANRFPSVRAAVFYGGPNEIIILSREHNDSNVLTLGARFVTESEAKEAVKTWLETQFTNEERHVRRIKKIDKSVII